MATGETAAFVKGAFDYLCEMTLRDCDPDRIHRLAGKLRFGTVWINDFNVYFTQAPWGGYKQSGLGRELGRQGLEEYQEVKHVYQNHAGKPVLWFGARTLRNVS